MNRCVCNPRIGQSCICTDNAIKIAADAIKIIDALGHQDLATILNNRLTMVRVNNV